MAAMRRDGKALAAIAEAWGVSRMVVVGIAHRNPELFPAPEKKKKEASKPAAAQRTAKAAKLLAPKIKGFAVGLNATTRAPLLSDIAEP